MADEKRVSLSVNGVSYEKYVEPRMTLADFIRDTLDLTGTHLGCEHGVCGACTILFNGEAVRSCLMLAAQADGAELMTVEGLAESKDGVITEGDLHPLQRAFRENHALQCGFCTPGFLMSAYALLKENPHPTEEEVRVAISGNICRCTGYLPIIKAILETAES